MCIRDSESFAQISRSSWVCFVRFVCVSVQCWWWMFKCRWRGRECMYCCVYQWQRVWGIGTNSHEFNKPKLSRPTSTKIDPDAVKHLTKSQQSELLDLLDCYSECFAVVPRYPNMLSHSSKPTLKEGFRPKLLPAYRVLERLKPMKPTVCMFVYVALLLICTGYCLSLIHIWRCRRIERCRSRWSPYH